ncbi:MAG: flagellar hook-basal body complex protein FliE [Acidobacteriota bacterium]
MRINPYNIQGFQGGFNSPVESVKKPSTESFAAELENKISQVNQLQNESDQAMSNGAVEGATNIHETMIKVEEADISLRLMNKVRSKAIEAYQEVMRMQF